MVNRRFLPLAGACFFLSGAAGLLWELVWTRLLGTVFGHSVYAIATVLAVFMGGLALGSALGGPWADRLRRPVRTYALLEAAIGAYCLVTPVLLGAVGPVYLRVFRSLEPSLLGASAIRAVLAAAVLLPATTLMGATLPVLARAMAVVRKDVGAAVSVLYALNTCGAVLGAAATGFVLLPTIGLRLTTLLGVGLNLAAGVIAAIVSRGEQAASIASAEPADDATPRGPPLDPRARRTVLVAIGASGAAAMGYEIAWTRALGLALGSSTYAFSAMLTTFLVGLALGAALVSAGLARRPLGLAAFGAVEVGAGLAALVLLPAFGRLPEAVLWLFVRLGLSPATALAAQLGLAFAVMIVPTLLVGATLPWALALVARSRDGVGAQVGRAYGANTVGTIAGSLLAGFVLLPALGPETTVLVAAAVNVAAGAAALAFAAPGRPAWLRAGAAVAAFAVILPFVPRWDDALMTSGAAIYAQRLLRDPDPVASLRRNSAQSEQLLHVDGLSSTVSVVRAKGTLSLKVNGKVDASNGTDMATQLIVGHLPALLHPGARRALVVGLASGVTASALALHDLREIDVAELEPSMRKACALFSRENRGVLRDPRVRVWDEDGRHVLAAAARPYDIVVSEPSNPWIAGVASLFTVDFYRQARERLAEGGVFVQWLQAYDIYPRDLRMIVRSFREVFPGATLWRGYLSDYMLVGSRGPISVDPLAIARKLGAASPALREDLASFHVETPAGLGALLALGEADLARFAEGAPLNTDDLPLLEFSAPLALYERPTLDENERDIRSTSSTDPAGAVAATDRERLEAAYVLWSLQRVPDALAALGTMGRGGPLPADLALRRARLLLALGLPEAAGPDLAALGSADVLQGGAAGLINKAARARLFDLTVPERHRRFAAFYAAFADETGQEVFATLAAAERADAARTTRASIVLPR
jgi:spermidine synthase